MLVGCILHVVVLSLLGCSDPQLWENNLSQFQVALVEFGRLVLFRNNFLNVFRKNMIRLLSQVMITMCQLPAPADELWNSSSVLFLFMQESHRKSRNYKVILGQFFLAQRSNIIRGMHYPQN
jgi:hypothetical protein